MALVHELSARTKLKHPPLSKRRGCFGRPRCITVRAETADGGSPDSKDFVLDRRSLGIGTVGMVAGVGLSGLSGNLREKANGGLTDEEERTVEVFNANTPSVVFITNLQTKRDMFTLDEFQAPLGAGSGFVWDLDGHVVTNTHVIKDADEVKVTLGDKQDSSLPAEFIGEDDDKDIAVLRLLDTGGMRLRPVKLGTSKGLRVGQKVYAIGNPFGLDHTCTAGIISGLGREISSGNTGRPIEGVIQTDAAINPGNSGGPVLDTNGNFIGMSTAIYSASGSSSGVGFALPVDLLKGIVEQIIKYGRVTRPVLGVSFAPDASSEQLGLGGVLVLSVRPGSPAEKAGVRPTTRDERGRLILGDVITGIDNERITNSTDLFRALDNRSVGDTVKVELQRGNRKEVQDVTLEDVSSLQPEPSLNTQDTRPFGGEEIPYP